MANTDKIKNNSDLIWDVANLLRGPYLPAQYRRVMILRILMHRDHLILSKPIT